MKKLDRYVVTGCLKTRHLLASDVLSYSFILRIGITNEVRIYDSILNDVRIEIKD